MANDVSAIISNAQSVAKEMAENASGMLDKAISAFDTRYEIAPGEITVGFKDVNFDIGSVPQYGGEHFIAPPEPGEAPATLPIPTLDTKSAPVNKAVRPATTLPITPNQLAEFAKEAPTLASIVIPPAPDALNNINITAPTLTDITVPDAPVVAVPEFTAQRPITDIQGPVDVTAQFRADFSDQGNALRSSLEGSVDAYLTKLNPRFHEQMSALENRLAKYIAGGTALSTDVENAIFARAVDKTNVEFLRTRDSIFEDGAARGFTMPGGSIFSAVIQARQAAADNNARAAMEIAIKQAELEQNNLQFAVSQTMNLRQMVIGAAQQWAGNLVQLNAQALQFAHGVLQSVVDLYEIEVKLVQSKVSVYQAEAQVYEYRLKAALAIYDVYQAHIAGLKAQVDVDASKVQAFTSQMNAYGAMANAYKAIVDGVATKAEIEKLKVEAFGAEVQAYSAKVAGKTAEWQGFRAQVEGNSAAIDAYKAEVSAYGTEVQAFATQIQARSTEIQAVSAANENAARTYAASVSAYTALVQGRSAAITAEINSFESTLKAYTAGMEVKDAQGRLSVANASAKGQVAVAAYKTQAEVVISNAQMNYRRMSDMAGVANAGANAYAGMASSALAGMNALASKTETYTY